MWYMVLASGMIGFVLGCVLFAVGVPFALKDRELIGPSIFFSPLGGMFGCALGVIIGGMLWG